MPKSEEETEKNLMKRVAANDIGQRQQNLAMWMPTTNYVVFT